MNKDITLRSTFNQDAHVYDAARPHYPEALYDDLIKITGLSNNAEVLEVGPGTGQATKPLANKGFNITAVELGDSLAKLTREKFKEYKNVKVIHAGFEDAELPQNFYDLVIAATAFHWINPEYRFSKPFKLLKSHRFLAIIHTDHISDEKGDRLFKKTQPIYEKYTPKAESNFRLPKINELKPWEFDEKLFEPIFFKAYPITLNYTGEQYSRLLSTYSPHIALPKKVREQFLNSIQEIIEEEFGDKVLKSLGMTLTIARKKG